MLSSTKRGYGRQLVWFPLSESVLAVPNHCLVFHVPRNGFWEDLFHNLLRDGCEADKLVVPHIFIPRLLFGCSNGTTLRGEISVMRVPQFLPHPCRYYMGVMCELPYWEACCVYVLLAMTTGRRRSESGTKTSQLLSDLQKLKYCEQVPVTPGPWWIQQMSYKEENMRSQQGKLKKKGGECSVYPR